jgi:hypothetical protein
MCVGVHQRKQCAFVCVVMRIHIQNSVMMRRPADGQEVVTAVSALLAPAAQVVTAAAQLVMKIKLA